MAPKLDLGPPGRGPRETVYPLAAFFVAFRQRVQFNVTAAKGPFRTSLVGRRRLIDARDLGAGSAPRRFSARKAVSRPRGWP